MFVFTPTNKHYRIFVKGGLVLLDTEFYRRSVVMYTDTLPSLQVRASPLKVHISYFLQNCKKGKSGGMDLVLLKNDITT